MTEPDDRVARLELVDRIVSAVSHDFNNVLTTVSVYAELVLMDGDVRGQVEDDVKEILAAARRGAAMTAFLGVATDRVSETSAPLDLAVDLSHLGKILGRLLPDGVTVRVVTPEEPTEVEGDRVGLQRAVFELAWGVAEELAGSGGEIEIRVVADGRDVRVEVRSDDGDHVERALLLRGTPPAARPVAGDPAIVVVGDATLARLAASAGLDVAVAATVENAVAGEAQRVIVAPATRSVFERVRRGLSVVDARAWVLVGRAVDVVLPDDLEADGRVHLTRAPVTGDALVAAVRRAGAPMSDVAG